MIFTSNYYAFSQQELIAQGPMADVAVASKQYLDQQDKRSVLFFDRASGLQVDVELNGSEGDIRARYQLEHGEAEEAEQSKDVPARKKGRGRPKLGVVGREVTLLPRHWAWLDTQRGGASAVLRHLVDAARKDNEGQDQVRRAQDAANRFMTALAGNLQGFEEATRALYAGDKTKFDTETAAWPEDVRDCARGYAQPALA